MPDEAQEETDETAATTTKKQAMQGWRRYTQFMGKASVVERKKSLLPKPTDPPSPDDYDVSRLYLFYARSVAASSSEVVRHRFVQTVI